MKFQKPQKKPSLNSYQSGKMYSRALFSEVEKMTMNYEGVGRNPLIVIHGFLGSKLKDNKSGKNVWGEFSSRDALMGYSYNHLRSLSHNMEAGKPLHKIKDSIEPTDFLSTVNINFFGLHFHVNAYDKMIEIFENAGYVNSTKELPPDKNFYSLFPFHYDWRRELSENAVRLHQFIEENRKYLKNEYKRLYGIEDFDVQFDIVAHSMGGLLTRYYLLYGGQLLPEDYSVPEITWDGLKRIDKIIIAGTPNCGYLDSFLELTRGLRIQTKGAYFPPGFLGTFPTYYQMLPQSFTRSVVYNQNLKRPVDLFNINTWRKRKWGIISPKEITTLKALLPEQSSDKKIKEIADEHLEKCLLKAKQFIKAITIEQTIKPPQEIEAYLFLGNAVKTARRASVNISNEDFEIIRYESGDGKVTTTSALMDLRDEDNWSPFIITPIKWKGVFHLEAGHMGITESPNFEDNVLYHLLFNTSNKQEEKRKKYNI